MPDREFNLLSEKWLRVMRSDASEEEVSLIELFRDAHRYADLAGETPTQNAAILRFLLAVLYTVFYRFDETGASARIENADTAAKRWEKLFRMGKFPEGPIENYLQSVSDRFWLFDPQKPFYQEPLVARVASKSKSKNDGKDPLSAAKLNGEIFEGNNKMNLFSVRDTAARRFLTYPEAARWLIHIVAYDDCALKKSADYIAQEARMAEKEDEGPGVGWAGKLGLVYATGDTLFETLMLNLVMTNGAADIWGEPKPVWEEMPGRLLERVKTPPPNNQPALLTYPSRQVMLIREAGLITSYYIMWGAHFDQNAPVEQMTLRRGSRERPGEEKPFAPLEHNPAQFFWQEFSAMFSASASEHRPGVVGWIDLIQKEGMIDKKRLIRFRSVAIYYKSSQKSSVDQMRSDTLSLRADILSELGRVWRQRILDELARISKIAETVGNLAREIDKADGGDGVAARERAMNLFYYALDEPFRLWLESLDTDDEPDEKLISWRETLGHIARGQARWMAESVSPAAYAGRTIKEKIKGKEEKRHYCAPKALNSFSYWLKRYLETEKAEEVS